MKGRSTPAALSAHEIAFYGPEARLVAPSSHEELLEIVRDAHDRKAPIVPAGLGAHAYIGNPPPPGAIVVSMRKLNRVLRYEPGDFTLGVQAGLTLPALREALARNGQEAPIDFARDARGTVGGLIAAAPPGPRRGKHGPARAMVIGVHALRCAPAGPVIYKAGGMVVKNVAGYEVMKLLAGSLGTAGVIIEVNLKLRPLPDRRAARLVQLPSRQAAWELANDLRARNLDPAALWVLEGATEQELAALLGGESSGHAVAWSFEGNAARVAWQEREANSVLAGLGAQPGRSLDVAELDALLDFLSEISSPGQVPVEDLGIARLASLPTDARSVAASIDEVLSRTGQESHGVATDALSGLLTARWRGPAGAGVVESAVRPLSDLSRTRALGGTLVYLPSSSRRTHAHSLVPDPNAAVARKLLRALDPHGIFSPGRILGML